MATSEINGRFSSATGLERLSAKRVARLPNNPVNVAKECYPCLWKRPRFDHMLICRGR